MIAMIIILGSVALAAAYTILWCLSPSLRRQIEAPSRRFAADAKRYDSHSRAARRAEAEQDEGAGRGP